MIKNKRTKIISAFPGTGKSHFHKENPLTTLDSDSSNFSWMATPDDNGNKVRNQFFPENYIDYIKKNIGKYDYIFVSSHEEVRKTLKDSCIFFYLVYPSLGQIDDYIDRYEKRGDSDSFINLVRNNWETWYHECDNESVGCYKFRMLTDTPHISDIIKIIENY